MEEDDIFDFKEENWHTFNIGSNSFGIGSHTSKFLPPFLKVPMESSKRASQSTKFTTNIQGKCPSITGLVGKLKKGGRPGAKFKIPKVQLPLQEVAVEEKDETTSRKEISLDIGRLSIAPKEEVKRKEELEESHEEMSDSQAVTEVLEEFVPVSESAHIEEDLREKIEEEPQRDPTYPFFRDEFQKDVLLVRTPVKAIPSLDNEASLFRKMTNQLLITQNIPFPKIEKLKMESSLDSKESSQQMAKENNDSMMAKTKEEAIQLIMKNLRKEDPQDRQYFKDVEKAFHKDTTSSRLRVNAILYPEEFEGILGSIEEKTNIYCIEDRTLGKFEEESSSIGGHHVPLASKINIQDIHVDTDETTMSASSVSTYVEIISMFHHQNSQGGSYGEFSEEVISEAPGPHVEFQENSIIPTVDTDELPLEAKLLPRLPLIDNLLLIEPSVEELMDQSSLIEECHRQKEAVGADETILQETQLCLGSDTPSTLSKATRIHNVNPFLSPGNPFLSPGIGKPTPSLISRFISDQDYWIFLLLVCCNQRRVIPFSSLFQDEMTPDQLCKIGESTYSEVFMCLDDPPFVIKIIPVRTLLQENEDSFYQEFVYKDGTVVPYSSRAMDVYNEVLMTKKLSPQSSKLLETSQGGKDVNVSTGFISCVGAYLVQGAYPDILLQIWRQHKETKKSENLCPYTFSKEQHFLVLMLSFGGTDLEQFKLASVEQAFSILHQILISIINAQQKYEFEHRDLHGGNILIQSTTKSHLSMVLDASPSIDNSDSGSLNSVKTDPYPSNLIETSSFVEVATFGVEIKIIDYTLSRMKPNLKLSSDKCLFSDLESDPEIFQGDAKVDFQYEMYRIMRRLIHENAEKLKNEAKTKKETNIGTAREDTTNIQASPWSLYCPKTNAAWIWFIMKYILIPKLASLKKIAAVKKKVFLELTKSLHDKVMEGEVSLHDWYWQNQRHFK